jgi:hypothetical protein
MNIMLSFDLDEWVLFRELVQGLLQCEDLLKHPDDDPVNSATRSLIERAYHSGSLYPTPGDRVWNIIHRAVELAAVEVSR